MDLMIESAIVAAVFTDVDHPFEATIESGVENPAQRFSATLRYDLTERLIPARLCGNLDFFELQRWNLMAQIALCLFDADERNTIPELESPGAWT